MSQQQRLPLWFLVVNWALLVIAFVSGALLGSRNRAPDLPEPQATALARIHAEILRSHVDEQDGQALVDRAIAAMVDNLDEYSKYVPPAELARYLEHSTGRYEGVGMLLTQQGEELVALFPFAGSAAERAGLRPGDRILAIDGKPVAELPLENRSTAATERVRGLAGTTVQLRIGRGDERLDVTVERAPVQRQVVKWVHRPDAEAGIGYLYLSDFHPGAKAAVQAALTGLTAQAPLRALILDLRFNGGGSLDECVAIARLFVREGTIVSMRRRDEMLEEYKADARQCTYPELPLVVLVNGHSASASEVLAGALQDHGRATIVGTRSYGKGFVNTVYSWPDLPLRLKLTTAHYYTPKGRNIDRPHHQHPDGQPAGPAPTADDTGGIHPDVPIEVAKEQFVATMRQLDASEVPEAHREAFAAVARQFDLPVPGPLQPAADAQLAAALQAAKDRLASPNGSSGR